MTLSPVPLPVGALLDFSGAPALFPLGACHTDSLHQDRFPWALLMAETPSLLSCPDLDVTPSRGPPWCL